MNNVHLPEKLLGCRIHMIGIKGTGMSALAELLLARGAYITGSDINDEFYTDLLLKKLGISIASPFSPLNIPADTDLIVYSPAYKIEENEELRDAIDQGLPCLSYPEALGLFSLQSCSVGIAGVHGKTGTTAMAGTILQQLDIDASVLAGSIVSNFGNSCTMLHGSKYFVAETCEYKHHFLHFHPKKIILTSIESDHQDYYPTYESILSAFLQYINTLPQYGELFYCADDAGARDAAQLIFASRPDLVFTPYGITANGDYGIKIHGVKSNYIVFSLRGFAGEFKIGMPGEHTVLNATAAIALAISLLKEEKHEVAISDITAIRTALASFAGVKRRSEVLGEVHNILFMDDYAHHPTAINATLKGLRDFYPKRRIIVDFMPHTYSRTEALLTDFGKSFSHADTVILHKVYASAREKYDGGVDGISLFEQVRKHHRRVFYFEEIMDARTFSASMLRSGDLFITMGAGDNWKLGQSLYSEFLQEYVQ